MIGIVDYGVGNLFSLQSSFKAIGAQAVVTDDEAVIAQAEKIILPGVGAFGDAKAKLDETGLVPLLKEEAEKKPFLGICLGMQIMVIEFARNVLGLEDANSSEMDPKSANHVIDLMEEQKNRPRKS